MPEGDDRYFDQVKILVIFFIKRFFPIYIAHNIIIYLYYVFTDLVYSAVVIEIIIDIIAQYPQFKIAVNKAAPTSTV